MIVAGVHGNEFPASIAAMKLANYLNGKKSVELFIKYHVILSTLPRHSTTGGAKIALLKYKKII